MVIVGFLFARVSVFVLKMPTPILMSLVAM